MEEDRPSPDLLLEQVQEEEQRKKEGQLKIFFGAAPGVGKTYAMLLAARQKHAEGIEVVAGMVETHGRPETEALLEGLEIIPRREIEYRGTRLREFDLDTALARKPEILLVDELAHTNVPGSRHKKRWQDVFELLSAGVNVYATLNVQHLESLNDVVFQISGITVRETLPDSVLDRADEIELIDLPPGELLQRLREGKVYVPELAQRAREHFFRQGNLLALREIALRRTAERVDAQLRHYRTIRGVTAVWPAAERIMVCVGPNPRSIQLIRTAKRMAAGLRAEWLAVTVEAPSTVKPSREDLRRLREHLSLAESLGAETAILTGHKASEELLRYARAQNATKMIIGKPTHPRWKDKIFGSLLDEVVRGSGGIDIYVMTGDADEPLPQVTAKTERRRVEAKEWALSLGIVLAATLLAELMNYYFTLVDLAMVYLLGIVLVAWRTSRWPSLVATFLSVMAYDFLFVPPRFTFSVSDARYFFTFIVMILVALVISRLTLRIREQAYAARQRERRTSALYRLSRELVHEQGIPALSAKAIEHLSRVLSCKVTILVPDEKGSLGVSVTGPETFALDPRELGVAQWTFDHRQQAGLGTDTLPGATALYLPLATSTRTVGVLGILPGSAGRILDQEQAHLLESFANQIALAIERALLADEARQALLKAETEALRNTLLSSVSHDLRTPLAAITGAATALLQPDLRLDQASRQELVQTIHEEANHLNEIIRNVLDMTRLESKTIKMKKEWQSLEEIVGVALYRLSEKLKDRDFRIVIPKDLPLVRFDPLLIEQVFVNLLDNALKYTPAATPLELKAEIREGALLMELADRGPGIPAGNEERIFDKFVRGVGTATGIGLGLTICRAIVKAHGGHIWAENRPGGGAVFRFTLPLEGEPHRPEPEIGEEVVDG
jgi:two-component system sensor histidine kinase KdpD